MKRIAPNLIGFLIHKVTREGGQGMSGDLVYDCAECHATHDVIYLRMPAHLIHTKRDEVRQFVPCPATARPIDQSRLRKNGPPEGAT